MSLEQRRFLKLSFQALADDTRLRMIGLLVHQERTVRELAGLLGSLSEPTVSHHLSKLKALGMVTVRAEGNRRYYRLDLARLDRFKRAVQDVETLAPEVVERDDAWIDALDLSAADKKVLKSYTLAGRLKQIPSKQKKKLAILRWLATLFKDGARYTEAQVNTKLARVHDDTAALRRGLIEFGYLHREPGGGRYWRAEAS
jgi:predicted transcriptional regulator